MVKDEYSDWKTKSAIFKNPDKNYNQEGARERKCNPSPAQSEPDSSPQNQDFVLRNAEKKKKNRRHHETNRREKKSTKEIQVETNAVLVVVILEGVFLRRPSVFFGVCGFGFRLQSTAKQNTVSKHQL